MIYADPNDFCHKRKINHFDSCNVLLAIATNIPVLLVTGFVIQGHISQRPYSLRLSLPFCLLYQSQTVS